jgi:hypothetical protein
VIRAALIAACAAGCVSDLDDPAELAPLDEPFFRCEVQPIMTRSCGAFACHGDGERFLRIFGRNRLRLDGDESMRNALMSDPERAHNFDAVRAFVDPSNPVDSLLLAKALDQEAGGYYHGGATEFERGDVFLSIEDPDYQTLLAWIEGATEDATCIEPGSNL